MELIQMGMNQRRKMPLDEMGGLTTTAPPTPSPGVGQDMPLEGGMPYSQPPQREMISLGMDQSADPYSTGVQGAGGAMGRQMMGQQQQSAGPLQPLSPPFGPTGAPSWGGPRFMNGGPRRRMPYQPQQAPSIA